MFDHSPTPPESKDTKPRDNATHLFKGDRVNHVMVAGRKIGISLEPEVWIGFDEICLRENCSFEDICIALNDTKAKYMGMKAALNLFVFDYFRCAATERGHQAAGHGLLPKSTN